MTMPQETARTALNVAPGSIVTVRDMDWLVTNATPTQDGLLVEAQGEWRVLASLGPSGSTRAISSEVTASPVSITSQLLPVARRPWPGGASAPVRDHRAGSAAVRGGTIVADWGSYRAKKGNEHAGHLPKRSTMTTCSSSSGMSTACCSRAGCSERMCTCAIQCYVSGCGAI